MEPPQEEALAALDLRPLPQAFDRLRSGRSAAGRARYGSDAAPVLILGILRRKAFLERARVAADMARARDPLF